MAEIEGLGPERDRDELRLFAYLMSGSLREADWLAESVQDAAGCLERIAERPRRSLPSLESPPSDPALPPEPGPGADT